MQVYDATDDDTEYSPRHFAFALTAAAAFFGLGAGFTYLPWITTAFVIGAIFGWIWNGD